MTSQIPNNENIKTFFYYFQKQFVTVPTDKAAKNFSFNCKKICISKLLNEIDLNGISNPINKFSSKTKNEIIPGNISLDK